MVLFVKTQHALLNHLHASDSALLSELKSWLRILEDSRVSLKAQGFPTESNHADSGDTFRKPGISHVAAYPALKLTQYFWNARWKFERSVLTRSIHVQEIKAFLSGWL